MAQAIQIVRVLRRREEERVAARRAAAAASAVVRRLDEDRTASSAVARASAISTITIEESDESDAPIATQDAPPIVTQDAPVVDRPRPPRARCASGRNCRSTSESGRSMTHLKCTQCNRVFCCRKCNLCVRCRPLPSYSAADYHAAAIPFTPLMSPY
jgi:hypothetical protein